MTLQDRRHLQIKPDAQAVADAVAGLLLAALQRGAVLGLATGRTMQPVYGALCARIASLAAPQRAALTAGWRSFNLDEYVGLGPQDPQSFTAFMHQALAVPLGLAPGQLQLPDGLAADPATEAGRYSHLVAAAGGIDLQLLGLGSNGHIGFNEPPCPSDAPCRCLPLSAATRRQNAAAFGGHADAVPGRAITLGTRDILAAHQVLLVVTGAPKAAILRRTLEEPPGPEVPASWLQNHPRLQVIVDAAAASALQLR